MNMILIRIQFNSILVSLKNRDSLKKKKKTDKQTEQKTLQNKKRNRKFTSFAAVAIIVA